MLKMEHELTLELMARSRFSAIAQYFLFSLAASYSFLNQYWSIGCSIAFAIFLIVNTMRFYFSNLKKSKVRNIKFILNLLIFLTSITWCVLFLFTVTSSQIDPIGLGVFIFIIAGVASSGVYSLSLSKKTLVIFVLPLILTMIVPFLINYTSWKRDLIPILIIILFFIFILGQQKKIFEAWLSNFNKKEELNTIFEFSPAGMALYENNQLTKANENFYHFLGPLQDKVNIDKISFKPIDKLIGEMNEEKTNYKRDEIEIYDRYYLLSAHKVSYKRNRFLVFIVDVDELKKTQKLVEHQQMALFQSSRLAALGEMSNGVAHEINNPLAIICSRSKQMIDRISNSDNYDKEKIIYNLSKIADTGFRIAHIVKSLQTFSRDISNDPFENVAIKQIILDSISLCQARLSHHEISIELNEIEDIKIFCQRGQMSQVFVNCISNSIDAISQTNKPRWIKIKNNIDHKNQKLQIQIIDSGNGIEMDIRDKIMNPFFTTKEIGKGMGLGLSVAKGIVEAHKGHIFFDHEAANTTLIIELAINN